MVIFAELIRAIALLLNLVFNVMYIVLVVRIVMSWVGADPYNDIARVIYSMTDPILEPFRRLPLQLGAVDFSPIIVFILLRVLQGFVMGVLGQIAARLG